MSRLNELNGQLEAIREGLDKIIVGQEGVKEQLFVCLLADGHCLIEGVPGTGKTLLILSLAKLMGCKFQRIQFTPDLMPTDLTGTNILNMKTQEFAFHPGPIFTDFLLADEINRTPPKTQSALLEVMQERKVTVDGTSRIISPVFTVFATQNPVEFEGTYPLPEAQTDRFLMKIRIDYPAPESELQILNEYASGRRLHNEVVKDIKPVMSLEALKLCREIISADVKVEQKILNYILQIMVATREDENVHLGASPRASIALLECSKAAAAVRGRDFVTPDDVKEMAYPVLSHRVTMTPEAEMEGMVLGDLVQRIFDKIEVPR